mmetsp:Transcript_41445/g.97170  ORF Transcript_41445/g.97170 Transcript_41445/m.97170 type:complete len:115 (+) Transcript_41445:637-981(+)
MARRTASQRSMDTLATLPSPLPAVSGLSLADAQEDAQPVRRRGVSFKLDNGEVENGAVNHGEVAAEDAGAEVSPGVNRTREETDTWTPGPLQSDTEDVSLEEDRPARPPWTLFA